MDNLFIKNTKTTPEINFNSKNHILEIRGSSYPENISEFYGQVFSWLNEYLEFIDDQNINVNIDLVYFNSTSSKVFMDLFDLLDEAVNEGKNINIKWYYDEDDTDSLEFGEEFQDNLESIKMEFVPKNV